MDDAPGHDPADDLPEEPPKRRREWWEWVLIVLGIIVLAVGGVCVAIIISLNQMY